MEKEKKIIIEEKTKEKLGNYSEEYLNFQKEDLYKVKRKILKPKKR